MVGLESGGGEGANCVAGRGGWRVCDRLGSRAGFALVVESEMRWSRALRIWCGHLESGDGGGLAIC